MDSHQDDPLYWESSYAIALNLIQAHPDIDVETVGTHQLYEWVINLANFADDPDLVSDDILKDILREWYEEINAE